MFTEILRIKPVLDTASAAKMEANLGSRFKRIAHGFRQGLALALKGSIIGLSLSLLTRFLNPLEKVEEKIRKLLDDAKAQGDAADELDSTPGKLRVLQNVSGQVGVTPDTLKDMLGKYAAAIEKAKDEINSHADNPAESTRALANYAFDKDKIESFFQFIQNLKGVGQASKGVGQIQTKDGMRDRTPAETVDAIWQSVFGERLRGQAKSLVNANYAAPNSPLKNQVASASDLDVAYRNLQAREQQDRNLTIHRDTEDLIRGSGHTSRSVIDALAEKAQRDSDQLDLDYNNFQSLKKAQEAVDTIGIGIQSLQQILLKVLTLLTTFVEFVTGVKATRLFRGISNIRTDN